MCEHLLMAKSSSRKPKAPSAADALAAATTLALAGTNTPATASAPVASPSVVAPDVAGKASDLTRATITLRAEDEAMLERIEDYLRVHDRRARLPRAMLIQIAVRSVQIGPELLGIAQAVKAQDARGRKKEVAS